MATRISDRVYNYCRDNVSVSEALAKDPTLSPSKATHKLYGEHMRSVTDANPPKHRKPASDEDLQRAWECGKWGNTRPSELFLRIYHDALKTLEHDPTVGVVSPPLMGSNGVLPLSVIGSIHDTIRHMSNLIARAEQEVFFATNFWAQSDASGLITDALKELSKRAGDRGQKVVVKILYDRANPRQVIDAHMAVPEKTYTAKPIGLPSRAEIPHVDLQVVNFHRVPVGTFHAKFMIVDRKYGVVASNNIQDNDNMEMMTHVEGDIVNSIYDTALISWHHALEPILPCIQHPELVKAVPTFQQDSFKALFNADGTYTEPVSQMSRMPKHIHGEPHYDPDIASEVTRMRCALLPTDEEDSSTVICKHLNQTTKQDRKPTAPAFKPEESFMPYVPHAPHDPFPIALVNRKPWGAPNHKCAYTPQSEAWLSAVRNAKESIFAQTPDLNAAPLVPEIIAAVKRGVEVTYFVCLGYNDGGELLPRQGGHNEGVAAKIYDKLESEEKKRLHVHYYVGKDQDRPIHNKFKARSCHVKIMIIDGHIGIQGNGNLDTQSFFHSEEVNIMIDSPKICGDWLHYLNRNQNTHMYGAGSQEDGIWRDKDGKEADGAIGRDAGKFAWAKGAIGAVQRVRGLGGF